MSGCWARSCCIAWPQERQLDLTTNPEAAKRLVNLFFLGQYLLASLMAPSFAAGAITGEKERKSYEMLLASPLRPSAMVLGKLLASMSHLALLIVASLPIIVLCLPLGGVSVYEVLAAYLGLMLSVVTFGMISLACSSYFRPHVSALLVSYLLILPLAMIAIFLWQALEESGSLRLFATLTVLPVVCLVTVRRAVCRDFGPAVTSARRWERRQGSRRSGRRGQDGRRTGDPAQSVSRSAVRAGQTRRLAAGRRRIRSIDKEMRSEIFAQGTLMLRIVIQVSILLAVPLMGACLYIKPEWAPWYICYVVLFNMLVGPVFSAGSITSERERETLDLLLTTILSPSQILWAKLISGLRVSSVLTSFLLWPLLLACVMVHIFRALVESGDHVGLCGDRGGHLPDHGDDRPLLFGVVPQDVGQPDVVVPGDRDVVHGAAGSGSSRKRFCRGTVVAHLMAQGGFRQPIRGGLRSADRHGRSSRHGDLTGRCLWLFWPFTVLVGGLLQQHVVAVQHALARQRVRAGMALSFRVEDVSPEDVPTAVGLHLRLPRSVLSLCLEVPRFRRCR